MGDGDEVHGRGVDVESFVVELHGASVGRATEVLQAMSNHTRELLELPSEEVIQEVMRGRDTKQASMLCLISPESAVPSEHPLRAMKRLVEVVLRELSPVFEQIFPVRASVPNRSGTRTGTRTGTE
jgi:hypothetical protein